MNNELLNHSYYTEIIKRLLKASFVGWVTEGGNKSLRVVINKEEHILPLQGGEEIRHETYSELIKQLLNERELPEPV